MISITLPQYQKCPGIILYKGSSVINGKEIVVIATGLNNDSNNPKTGQSVQIWILAANMNPITALTTGKDDIVCNDCKHRSVKSGGYGTCYVNIHQAPYAIYNAWKNGKYEKPNSYNIHAFDGRDIRIGSYGDPANVPIEVWETITKNARSTVSYTHNWKRKSCQQYKKFCMASCDTVKEALIAKKLGWRTFRIRSQNEPLLKHEFECPASTEQNKRLTCQECKACDGIKDNQNSKKVGNPCIIVHGRKWKMKRFVNIMNRKAMKKGYKDLLPV